MAKYAALDDLFGKEPKPPKMDDSNPNKQFKHRKWLDNLKKDISEGKHAEANVLTKDYVDKHVSTNPCAEVGVGIDISTIGANYNTTKVALHDEQTPAPQLKVDEHGNEYEERFDTATGTRYLTYSNKETVHYTKGFKEDF